MKLFLMALVLLGPIMVSQLKIAALEEYAECMSGKTENTPDTVCKQIWTNRFVQLPVLQLSLKLKHRSQHFSRMLSYSTSTSEASDSKNEKVFTHRFVQPPVLQLLLELHNRSQYFSHSYSTSTSEAPNSENEKVFSIRTGIWSFSPPENMFTIVATVPPPLECPRNQKYEPRKKMCTDAYET